MREIKFRFWDLDSQKMITYPIEGVTQHSLGESLSTNLRPLIRISGEICQPHWGSNCITMQYTGLKDKKGKEIYEGDIVKCYDHPTNIESGIFKVVFRPGQFECGGKYLSDWGSAWVEVIGNIYEHPELLKD